jgi:hypothetical protein
MVKRPIPLLEVLPANLDTPDFRKAWDDWKLYQRQSHKKIGPMTAARQLEKLSRAGPVVAIAMIEQSITMNWTGLFEVKNGTNQQNTAGAGQVAKPAWTPNVTAARVDA